MVDDKRRRFRRLPKWLLAILGLLVLLAGAVFLILAIQEARTTAARMTDL